MRKKFDFAKKVELNGLLLLVSCSSKKLRTREPVEARLLYKGGLIRASFRYANRFGYRVLILSAKHGFISPEHKIAYYDQKLESPYNGEYPEGEGVYVGSKLYFGNAPSRFKRLLPLGFGIGQQMKWLNEQVPK